MIAATLVAMALAGPASADTVVTLGDRPTVVAFVGAELGEVMFSADWAGVVGALKPGLDAARAGLEAMGVAVREVYGAQVTLRARGAEWALEPSPATLLSGYYLWAPDRPRYVCRGARSGPDLLELVGAFVAGSGADDPRDLPGCVRTG